MSERLQDGEKFEQVASRIDRPVVVGIGASAGGLEAISLLLKGIPDDSGMSFVIIQHLDPTHKSALVEILSRRTSLPIHEVEQDTEVQANQIYVIPPGQYLAIENCVLKLSEPQDPRGSRMAIDYFLTSLAEDASEFGIGVVLSGTGSDGTAGLQEIKHYGGLTVVQDPEEAEHKGMPHSAIESVHIDYVIPAEKIGPQLGRYVSFCRTHGPLSAQSVAQVEQSDLSPILDLLRKEVKHDFRRYRHNTLMRRIQRRMGLHQLDQIADYKALLADNTKERDALRCDLLIGVTRFFRNPDAWKVLETKVVAPMLQNDPATPVRIWCAGCATGEEAYSIAMVLLEQIAVDQRKLPFQIFATDVAEDALAFARTGIYPEAIMKDVPLERLRRFFKKEPGGYRVSKQLRESVVFANQNVLAQPPFAKLDLILCRNLLIYLQREAQDRVMNVFQFALKEGGVLFQGSSESVGQASDLFVPVSKKHRIYRRNELKAWPPAGGDFEANVQPLPEFSARERKVRRDQHHTGGIAAAVQRNLLQQLGHGILVVNHDNRVLFAEGEADAYVQFGIGELAAELPDVMEIARKGIKAKLRSALRKFWSGQALVKIDARVHRDRALHRCELRISKLPGRPDDDPAAMILFSPITKSAAKEASPTRSNTDAPISQSEAESKSIVAEQSLMEVEHELTITREQLNSSIADLESANEELKAANEEAMTMNEELQSSNEELETSKEELQSLNEELTTLNNQLEIKVDELEDTTNDLENLLTSSDVPTVFLDTQFRIRRYTPTCRDLFHFIAGDVGRPLEDIKACFDDPTMLLDAKEVLQDLQPREKQVASTDGDRRYRRRMLPYRTEDNRIQGVVMTLTDITDLLAAQEQAQRQLAEIHAIYATTPVGLALVDTELTYLSINEQLAAINGPSVEEHLGKTVDEILPSDLAEQVRGYYRQVLESQEPIFDLEVVGRTAVSNESNVYLVSYVPVSNVDGELLGVNTVVQDITRRKRRESNLALLADLQTSFNPLQSVDRLLRVTCQRTADFLDLSHCCFVEVDPRTMVGDVIYDHVSGDRQPLVGRHAIDDYHTADEQQALLSGKAVAVNDLQRSVDNPHRRANLVALEIGSVCNVAFVSDGRIKFIVGAHKRQPHQWRADELELLQDVAQQLCVRIERARAEQELAEAKERLDLSLEVASIAPWNWDIETSNVIPNPMLNRMFGFDEQSRPKLAEFIERIDPDARKRISTAIERSISSGQIYDQEYPIHLPGGEVRHVRARGAVRRSDDGEMQDFFGVVADITQRKREELDLAERESHLRRVINNQLGLVGVIDRNGILLEIDDQSLDIARARREDVIGKHFADAPWWNYDPKVSSRMREAMDRAYKGEVVRYDVSLFARGDEGVLIDFMIAPLKNKSGEIEYLIPSGVDIRERSRAEHQQQEITTRLEAIFNAAVDGIITFDRHGTIDSVNSAACRTFGYDHPELIGKNIKMLMPASFQSEHDRYLRKFEQAGDQEITGDQRMFRGLRKDGTTFPLELAVSETMLTGEHQFVEVVRDMSDRVAYEHRLKETSRRMEMALRAGGLAAWEWTPEASVWTAELYELLGIDVQQDASSELFFSLVHPEDVDGLKSHWQTVIDGTESYDAVFRIIRPDGQIRWINGLGDVVRNKAGNVIKMYGVNWDSTREREQAAALRASERRAHAANASKSEFLANMSHEIRTPMTAILGYADLLKPRVNDQEALGYLNTIRRNGDFLLEIINDILDLSKIEADKLEIVAEQFDPVMLIEEVRVMMEVRASEKELSLEVDYEGKLPGAIESDPKRLRQILINLVGNAIKFTKTGGVTIAVKFSGDTLQLRVIDTGIGIDESHQQRLFQPFSQADSTVAREFGGTGLGLAISQRLAKLLGGEIAVESEKGKGSTFMVSIGVGNIDDVDFVIPQKEPHPDPPTSTPEPVQLNCRILLVDDRRDVRFLSRTFLSRAGATVSEAEDGELAVAAVTESLANGNAYDLVLLDMQMPKLDGYQTAKALRDLGFTKPIIALTADAMHGDMKRCMAAGCNDYLSKPIDKHVLLQKVQAQLGE